VICGFGEAEKAILESQDKRIVYLGKVDRKQALALQQRATVLVNPRQNTEEFTKYSFPSKTMEYLASGVPVVAYKLDGIPDEYDPYLNYVPDNSVEALAGTIQKIINMSAEDRKEIGRRGQKFVLEEKNAQKQTKRILDLINGIEMKTYR
jgi:glycosyltransferase involved in cell wall biosynthesis